MDEAEKLCQRLLVMSHGKIVAEGVPRKLINEKVKHYALEIREAASLPLQKTNGNLLAVQRGTVHLYFAESTYELTPLMQYYGSRPMLLRPANLEDVFLQLLEK